LISRLEAPTKTNAEVLRLANGLTVIHHNLPATPVVVTDIWVRAGARVEMDEWSGMAHFLEHMIFKGSDRLMPGEFDWAIEGLGGVTNAATSHDYAHYYMTTASEYWLETLPYLAELVLRAAIPDDEFDRERQVVLEEIRQSEDDPDWVGFQVLMESVYRSHPYGRSVLGAPETLLPLSPEEMRSFHRTHYQPENLVVVVVGDVARSVVLDQVQQWFAEFPTRNACPLPNGSTQAADDRPQRLVLEMPQIEQARLMMAWRTPGIGATPSLRDNVRSACGLDMLSAMLSEGRNAQLVRELREELGLVQDISCNFSLQQDSSLFTITAWLEPERIPQVEDIIRDRVQALGHQTISADTLKRYQRLLSHNFAFSTETPDQLASLYGYYGTLADPAYAMTYPQQVQMLSPELLQHLAYQHLAVEDCTVMIMQPALTIAG